MAAPVTHIIFADKVFDKHFRDKDRKQFIIGTSFPDIRYLGAIDRKYTHFDNVFIPQIKTKDPFTAGLMFHSFIDKTREDFVRSKNIYSLLPSSPYIAHSIKFYEDYLLYDQLKNWQEIVGYFDTILESEISIGVRDDDVKRWHTILQRYLTHRPENTHVRSFVQEIQLPNEAVDEISRIVDIIKDSSQVTEIIWNFYKSFDP